MRSVVFFFLLISAGLKESIFVVSSPPARRGGDSERPGIILNHSSYRNKVFRDFKLQINKKLLTAKLY